MVESKSQREAIRIKRSWPNLNPSETKTIRAESESQKETIMIKRHG